MTQTREEALAHFGVKGMKWGQRHTPQPGSRQELRREVKAASKGKGVARGVRGFAGANKDGSESNQVTGHFVNTQGKRVNQEYANMVLSKAIKRKQVRQRITIGAAFIAATALIKL